MVNSVRTVLITGSARGFGYAMAYEFYNNNYNVVLCDVNEDELKKAHNKLINNKSNGKVLSYRMDVTNESDIDRVINDVISKLGTIDIWINNAGVNQEMKMIWEVDSNIIDRLVDIDLKGTMLCSKYIMKVMLKQKHGSIYNVEGHGSNDATIPGLSIYGTCKRGVTYFTEALARECRDNGNYICIGKITPGIMITNFIDTSMGDGKKIDLDEKTKNIYNILGDKPEVIAKYMVKRIINNKKKNVKFTWLTSGRAALRFIKAMFGFKNNYFE